MTSTLISGPSLVAGALLGYSAGGVPEYNPDGGPSVSYQGDCFPDVRFPIFKDYLDRGGVVPAHLNNPFSCVINATPVASTTTGIAAAAAVTTGTAMTLATTSIASGGVSPGTPVINQATGQVVSGVVIEAGFTTGTTTAASGTISSIPALGVLQMFVGQWLVIPNVGNSAGTSALITQVTSIASATSVTVSPAPAASLVGARIGQGNLFNTLWGGTALALVPYIAIPGGGPAAPLDPAAAVTRTIAIQSTNAGATGGNFTVRGLDGYGYPMTEIIAKAAGVSITYGKKGFKTVLSVTPAFTDAQTYSVGIGDEVGLPLRSDLFEFITIFYNQAPVTSATGWTAADTAVATGTTADTRGRLAIGSLNNAGAGIAGGAFNGTRRLSVSITIPVGNLLAGTPQSAVAMYGNTQFSG